MNNIERIRLETEWPTHILKLLKDKYIIDCTRIRETPTFGDATDQNLGVPKLPWLPQVKETKSFYNHLFFVTVTYKKSNANPHRNLNDHVTDLNNELYKSLKELSKRLIDGNISRQYYYQPKCFMFVDAASTKNGTPIKTSQIGENTHHHGIILIHPKTLDKFEKLLIRRFPWGHNNGRPQFVLKGQINNKAARLHIELVPSKEEALKIINYSQKLAIQFIDRPQIYADTFIEIPYNKEGKSWKTYGDEYKAANSNT